MRLSTVLISCSLAALAAASIAACSDDDTTSTDGATAGPGSGGSGATSSGTGAATSSSSSTGAGATGAQGGGGSGAVGGAGGSGGGAGGAGGGTGGGAGSGGGANVSGDCASDADCPGGTCQPVTQGGWKVCVTPPDEATMCQGSNLDECCTTADCLFGKCFENPVTPFCGGIQPAPYNVCAGDQCVSDVDCRGNGVCVPAGALGYKVKACLAASCKVDTDCMDEAGGVCAPITEPCCDGTGGIYCVYPSDGCRKDADCAGGYCSNDGTRSKCEPGSPICPL